MEVSGNRDEAPQQRLPAARTNPARTLGQLLQSRCDHRTLGKHFLSGKGVRGRTMSELDAGYDYTRYHKLLAEAVDETKRLELIDLLIREKARDRLQAQRMSDRVAMTTATVAKVLGTGGRREVS